ncbi:MAG: 4-(cytidine 5'-diphospho)-2-C-methyl-D-erythritol kinase, partial [Clostridia bacterium]|nr:4-(cytidine 5'-diphospho)-2-C-methyl-D-erythritol kinase [Clostridia bacterium]
YNLSMDYVRVKAYAKINLTLDITGVCAGFHCLDSVVASIDICDLITAKKRRDGLVSVTMHGEGSELIPFEQNNAAKAAQAFDEAFGTGGADITVWKNIPVGAGLGGSSADVAGVLNAMAKLYGVTDRAAVKRLADGIGSDCGYMLTGGYARLYGRGDIIQPLDTGVKLDLGLIVPSGGVSTPQCYALYDKMQTGGERKSEEAVKAILNGDRAGLGKNLSNALTAPAIELNGEISGCMAVLKAFDPLGVSMTGSGSAVFALFENDTFLRYAQSRYRGKYKFITTRTIVPKKEG